MRVDDEDGYASEAQRLDALVSALAERGAADARVALVLGSGLGALVERVEDARAVPFADLSGMPTSSVLGHAGRLVLGTLAGVPVLVQQGRVHLYEGHASRVVTRSVRAYARLGVETLLLTNAAGCLRTDWKVPSLMRLTDHLDLQGAPTLARGEGARARVYDPSLGRVLDEAGKKIGLALHAGMYVGLAGPSYETPAEIRMFQGLQADAVGMSTVAEAAVGRRAGLRVAALSCLSNYGSGLQPGALDHAEVVAAGQAIAERFARLVLQALPGFARN